MIQEEELPEWVRILQEELNREETKEIVAEIR